MHSIKNEIKSNFREKELECCTELQEQKEKKTTCRDVLFPLADVSINPKVEKMVDTTTQGKNIGHEKIKMYGRASGVPIHNPDDAVEVAIKNNIELFRPYKSWNAIFREIGVEVLRDAGILDLSQSFYKEKAQKLLSHYGEFTLTGRTRYERSCTVLYEEPRFEFEISKKGNRFYRDRGTPLLLRFLKKEFVMKGNIIHTTPDKLAIGIGLVNHRFNETSKTLKEVHPNLTEKMVSHFHLHCKPELDKVIYSLLDELQSGYNVIFYQELHWITLRTGETCLSDAKEETMIKEAEKYILERDFQTTRINMVFFKRKEEKFYSEVVKYINQKNNLNWYSYRKTIQIQNINDERIMVLLRKMPTDAAALKKLAVEINQRFHERMRKKIHSDYDKTNRDADEKDKKYVEEAIKGSLYQNLRQMGYTHEKTIKMVKPRKAFRVHENCYEYQDILMETILKFRTEKWVD